MSSRPLRVFVINAPEAIGGVTWWRMYRPLQLMHRAYPEIQIIHNETGHLFPHHFQYIDIVLAFRPSEPAHVQGLQMARQAGVPIISDYDDDLINIPVGHPSWPAFREKEKYIRHCVAMSTQLWVSTPALRDVYGHPNTVVIPNAILESDLPENIGPASGIVAWRGGVLHREDIEISAFRADYVSTLSKIKQFIWIGYMPTWGKVSSSHANIMFEASHIDTRVWFSYLQHLNLQAIVKPLMPCQFNDCKSNISWMEATIAGAVLVTNYAGKPGWELACREYPRRESDRVQLWQKSRDEIVKNYNLIAWNEARYREILRTVFPSNNGHGTP